MTRLLSIFHSFTHSLTYSPTHSFTHPFTHTRTHPPTHSPTHSFTLTHSLYHPLTHTHPLTHLQYVIDNLQNVLDVTETPILLEAVVKNIIAVAKHAPQQLGRHFQVRILTSVATVGTFYFRHRSVRVASFSSLIGILILAVDF